MAVLNQIFMVIGISEPDAVRARLQSLNLRFFELKSDTWFVLYSGTATEAAEEFGVRTKDSISTGVVASIENVGGRANPDLWEWLKVNRPDNG